MAQYTRFEIFIPVTYRTQEVDAEGRTSARVHSVDQNLLREFIAAATAQYGGMTQANPSAPALYKGWWQQQPEGMLYVDHLTYMFGLVRIDQSDEAEEFFTFWKKRFETSLKQDVILVLYYAVHTIGDFF